MVFVAGALGSLWSVSRAFFGNFTFVVLGLGAVWVFVSSWKWLDRVQIGGLLACYVLGFGMEWWGVRSGAVFGAYRYGALLGPGWDGVPWLIGVNWVLLVWAARAWVPDVEGGGAVQRGLRDTAAATLVAVMDMCLEPGATFLGFWTWEHPPVLDAPWSWWWVAPARNYLAWWLLALVMLRILSASGLHGRNPEGTAAVRFYALGMMVFFGILLLGRPLGY